MILKRSHEPTLKELAVFAAVIRVPLAALLMS
jgi:hypothetical protein